jgi:hypothetical protein
MIKIIEVTLTMLVIMVSDKINDIYKDKMMELHLDNGKISLIKVIKSNSYSCPRVCEASHYHHSLVSTNKTSNYNLIYKNKILYINDIKVNTAFIVKEKKKIDKKNKHVKKLILTKEQVDINNFFNKFYE